MSAERTEDATAKRRRDERNKGNISKSQDMTAALMVTIGIAVLYVNSSFMMENFQALCQDTSYGTYCATIFIDFNGQCCRYC